MIRFYFQSLLLTFVFQISYAQNFDKDFGKNGEIAFNKKTFRFLESTDEFLFTGTRRFPKDNFSGRTVHQIEIQKYTKDGKRIKAFGKRGMIKYQKSIQRGFLSIDLQMKLFQDRIIIYDLSDPWNGIRIYDLEGEYLFELKKEFTDFNFDLVGLSKDDHVFIRHFNDIIKLGADSKLDLEFAQNGKLFVDDLTNNNPYIISINNDTLRILGRYDLDSLIGVNANYFDVNGDFVTNKKIEIKKNQSKKLYDFQKIEGKQVNIFEYTKNEFNFLNYIDSGNKIDFQKKISIPRLDENIGYRFITSLNDDVNIFLEEIIIPNEDEHDGFINIKSALVWMNDNGEFLTKYADQGKFKLNSERVYEIIYDEIERCLFVRQGRELTTSIVVNKMSLK